jgi:hypothetical protein
MLGLQLLPAYFFIVVSWDLPCGISSCLVAPRLRLGMFIRKTGNLLTIAGEGGRYVTLFIPQALNQKSGDWRPKALLLLY